MTIITYISPMVAFKSVSINNCTFWILLVQASNTYIYIYTIVCRLFVCVFLWKALAPRSRGHKAGEIKLIVVANVST